MKLRAFENNSRCWNCGDEFECKFDEEGYAYIICNTPGSQYHPLMSPQGYYTRNPRHCPDFEVIEESTAAIYDYTAIAKAIPNK